MALSYEEVAALEAWKKPKGEHEIDLTHIGHPVSYRVARHSKFVLVFNNDNQVIAFPKPEHIPAFYEAVKGLEPLGPASYYPGSIGSILAVENPSDTYVLNVQSHYRQESDYPVPDNLARKYYGWRKVALNALIRRAKENKIKIHFRDKVTSPDGIKTPKRTNHTLIRELEELAEEHGKKLKEHDLSRFSYLIDFSEKL